MRKAELPFELIDRYDGHPQQRPVITYEDDWDSFDWRRCYDYMYDRGLMFDSNQYHTLFDIAQNGKGGGWLVEIGTDRGAGAIAMAIGSKSVKREKVITIDNNFGTTGERTFYRDDSYWGWGVAVRQRLHLNILSCGVQDWVLPFGITSSIAAEILDIKIRLLHVDACHLYPHPAADILMWEDKLIPGAWVVCHDYKHEVDDVERCINEFVVPNPRFGEVIEISPSTCKFQRLDDNC